MSLCGSGRAVGRSVLCQGVGGSVCVLMWIVVRRVSIIEKLYELLFFQWNCSVCVNIWWVVGECSTR